MIREFNENDLLPIMQIWLDSNIDAHSFIPAQYWLDNADMVKDMLPQAEIYVYEDNASKHISGFIGLNENYIEGIFVERTMRSKGIGRQLLDYVKAIKPAMSLNVYQKNSRAVAFYQREHFVIRSESLDSDTNEKDFLMVWSKLR